MTRENDNLTPTTRTEAQPANLQNTSLDPPNTDHTRMQHATHTNINCPLDLILQPHLYHLKNKTNDNEHRHTCHIPMDYVTKYYNH